MTGTRRAGKWTALLLSVLAVSAHANAARAADPPGTGATETTARERPSTRSFYGWQILASAEAGGVAAAAALALPESPLKTLPSTLAFLVGMPLYALGGPATHWTHGDFSKGLVSLAGNIALPIMGGFVGQAVRCAPDGASDDCATRGFVTGFAIALVTGPVIDALVLGWEDIADDDPAVSADAPAGDGSAAARRPVRARRAARFTLLPAWSFGPKGNVAFGVAGRF